MPYVDPVSRKKLDMGLLPENPGELNYSITTLIMDYLENTDRRYGDYNAVIGVLECAKQELYRREISPYEDKKKMENGDVYSRLLDTVGSDNRTA